MTTSNPMETLLLHDRWATQCMLEACAALSQDQFHQRFEMGRGSLHDTLTHVLGAIRGWGDMLAGRAQRERLEESGPYTVAQLKALLDELHDDIEASVRAHNSGDPVTGERGGRSYTFMRGGVVTHVMTHGMHHRAQCLNMLRQLGVEQLPHSSVVEWMMMVDGQG